MSTLRPAVDPLIREWARSVRSHWSAENVYNAVGNLNRAADWLTRQGSTLATATPGELSDYLADRRELVAASTVQVDHRHLTAFYRWAAEDPDGMGGYVARNPMLRVRAPKQDQDPAPERVPEVEEWQYRALLETCRRRRANDRRDAAVLALMWHTGLRRSEVVRLRYEHVEWDAQMVHLAQTKGRTHTKSRDVWVDDEAMELLSRYVFERGDAPGPLFLSTHRVPGTNERAALRPNSVSEMILRRARLAEETQRGLPGPMRVPAHGFRRGHASAWLEAGGSVTALETNNGWKHDGRMAARYTRARETQIAATEARRLAEARRARARLRVV
jgi:integrase